jgi:broad specificity phosphatase PhoE
VTGAIPSANTFQNLTGAAGAPASLTAPTVVLIRHGETALGRNHIIERPDTPLDDQGRMAIAHSAQRVAQALPVRRVYSGTLSRSLESGQTVAQRTGAPLVPLNDLRAWNVGMYDGVPEAKANPPLGEYKKYPQVPIPDGESYSQHLMRSLTAAHAIFNEARMFPGQATVMVTHSSVISPIWAWLKAGGQGYRVDWPTIFKHHGDPPQAPAGVERLEYGPQGWQPRPLV